jgi:DegV family protein with EDD domain
MSVKIVTDSDADFPPQLVKDLDITVIPQYVIFGSTSYRGGVDITDKEFYQRLLNGPVFPTTSQPTLKDFVDVYTKLAKEADGIISIHVSSKLSGTANAAEQASKMSKLNCPIEIIDSLNISIGMGLIVIAAARMAKAGKGLNEIAVAVKSMVSRTKLLMLFGTLEYLAKGGRIGKAKSLLGSMLNVKPILTLKDGEIMPVTQAHSRSKGTEKLLDFIKNAKDIEEVGLCYTTLRDEAIDLASRVSAISKANVLITQVGPALGAHGGPGAIGIALMTKSE